MKPIVNFLVLSTMLSLSTALNAVELIAGWNLVANNSESPIQASSTFVDPAKVKSVWKWNATTRNWAFYAPSMTTDALASYAMTRGYEVLSTIPSRDGYWINAAVSGTIATPEGNAYPTGSELQVGWNLGGGADNQTAAQFVIALNQQLSTDGKQVSTIWTWDGVAGKWRFHAPSLAEQGGTALADYRAPKGYANLNTVTAFEGVWINVENKPATTLPITTLPSSYENKLAAGSAIGPQVLPNVASSTFMIAYAYGDFFRDGSYTLVASYATYKWPDGEAKPGIVRFFKKEGSGWTDVTPKLLSDDTGCTFARKALVADLNGDKKPDVFWACTGVDSYPFPGEQQRMLLSQPDGTYKNVLLPFRSYSHGGAAADFDGSGYADVVLADLKWDHASYYLKNNRNGTFTEVNSLLPPETQHTPILSLEMLDINGDGKPDLWTCGDTNGDNSNNPPAYYLNNGNGSLSASPKNLIPTTYTKWETGVDVVKIGKYLYTTFEFNRWDAMRVEAYDVTTKTSTEVYSHTGSYPTYFQGWFPWIDIYNNTIVSSDKLWPVSIPLKP